MHQDWIRPWPGEAWPPSIVRQSPRAFTQEHPDFRVEFFRWHQHFVIVREGVRSPKGVTVRFEDAKTWFALPGEIETTREGPLKYEREGLAIYGRRMYETKICIFRVERVRSRQGIARLLPLERNMKGKWILVGSLLACVLSGCATASLSTRGGRVLPIAAAPGPECENLGTVFGQGGGAFGGAYISNDQLMEYAMNDAMNKAAERGATHLQASSPQLGGSEGTTTTATVAAIAYRCPNSGANSAAASAPAPASTSSSFLDNCSQNPGESARQRAIRCKAEAASQSAKE